LVGFITLPLLSKSFCPETYVLWTQILVTGGLLSSVLNFQLGTATVRYLSSEQKKDEINQLFSNMFWIILLSITVIIILSFLYKSQLIIFIFNNVNYQIIIFLTFILHTNMPQAP